MLVLLLYLKIVPRSYQVFRYQNSLQRRAEKSKRENRRRETFREALAALLLL